MTNYSESRKGKLDTLVNFFGGLKWRKVLINQIEEENKKFTDLEKECLQEMVERF